MGRKCMARKGRVIDYAGNSRARDINGNRTQNWRIDMHHYVAPQFADNSMPIKIPDTETSKKGARNLLSPQLQ